MRFLLGACILLALACPVRLAAQEAAPAESSILTQRELPELQPPPDVEAGSPDSAGSAGQPSPDVPSEIMPSLPQAEWVQGLRFPRREYPRPLAWWYGESTSDAPQEGNWITREWGVFRGEACDTVCRLWRDYQFQYSLYPLCELGAAVGLAMPLANTRADQAVSDWYQRHIRTASMNQMGKFGYFLGSYQYMLPMYFGVWTMGRMADDTFAGAFSADWANRSLRAMAIGAPEVGVLQYLLGGSRPQDYEGTVRPADYRGSRWRPLHDNNGVSGHAFVGAVPFLTAASMCENPWCRGACFVGSFWSTWSRINSDSHYLSQALLGWFIAYQSVRSVNRTEAEERQVQVGPWVDPGITGINVFLRY